MPRVVHFEIPADDPGRAAKFYEEVFGWTIAWDSETDYFAAITGEKTEPGIDGGLMKREAPLAGTTNTIKVASVDDFLKRIADAGGEIVTPKQTIPGGGYHSYCKDTEGNLFGIFQSDPDAK